MTQDAPLPQFIRDTKLDEYHEITEWVSDSVYGPGLRCAWDDPDFGRSFVAWRKDRVGADPDGYGKRFVLAPFHEMVAGRLRGARVFFAKDTKGNPDG